MIHSSLLEPHKNRLQTDSMQYHSLTFKPAELNLQGASKPYTTIVDETKIRLKH